MTAPATAELQKTALNAAHRRIGGKMVDFGGWDMPLEYSGIIAEHTAVRTAAGLFDVSHMGEIFIEGPGALNLVQKVSCNDAAKLAVGQIQYSGLMTSAGTFVDDILVHKFSDTKYFFCVNAGNQEKDFAHIVANNTFDCRVENAGPRYSQIALQGPKSLDILERFTSAPIGNLKYYRFMTGVVDGVDCIIARTGYTGEDGFELYFSPELSEKLWFAILESGKADGMIPCGLGARNTLRLEANMCLYGHEIDEAVTVWEANLGWICKMDKGDFLGRDALAKQKEQGVKRILAGFEVVDRLIARDGCPVFHDNTEVGRVTTGAPSMFLKKHIGLAFVPPELSAVGTEIQIGIRSHRALARIVPLPFYKRAK
ncbi:MAG: glycine cleavage system aminomethyltransferase GcvT [Acidobacteria bacterium]|nr:glycine cleavage system aminomethyltransferase GcvT [Acidobacteriota bacterium]